MENKENGIIPIIYKGFETVTGSSFQETADHFKFLIEVAEFYNEHPVPMESLDQFIVDYSTELLAVLVNENFPQLRSPSTIVIFYYLVCYEWRLRDNWWRSERELKLIYTVFGYSWGNY